MIESCKRKKNEKKNAILVVIHLNSTHRRLSRFCLWWHGTYLMPSLKNFKNKIFSKTKPLYLLHLIHDSDSNI